MSPRMERIVFRLSIVGLVLLAGAFVYRTVINPPGPDQLRTLPSEEPLGEDVTPETGATQTDPAADSFVVISPPDQTVVAQPELVVAGFGTPGAIVQANAAVTAVDSEGVWSLRVVLVEGPNILTFTETRGDGGTSSAGLGVTYEPPPDAP